MLTTFTGPRMCISAPTEPQAGLLPRSALSLGLEAAAVFHKIKFSSLKAAFANRTLLNGADI